MEETNELKEYFCSNCGTRVNKEDTKCAICGAELEGFDDDGEMTVKLKVYEDFMEAELAEKALNEEGIDCYIYGRNDWSMATFFNRSVTLIVLKKDVKRALEILEG
jgi:DNA-directed RNA polymerase subunit RPC12/RpoP